MWFDLNFSKHDFRHTSARQALVLGGGGRHENVPSHVRKQWVLPIRRFITCLKKIDQAIRGLRMKRGYVQILYMHMAPFYFQPSIYVLAFMASNIAAALL